MNRGVAYRTTPLIFIFEIPDDRIFRIRNKVSPNKSEQNISGGINLDKIKWDKKNSDAVNLKRMEEIEFGR